MTGHLEDYQRETNSRVAAHRAALSASQQVRDDALRAEVVLLRDEHRRHQDEVDRLRADVAGQADQIERLLADLETCRVQRDAASAVADLAIPAVLAPSVALSAATAHYWAVTR